MSQWSAAQISVRAALVSIILTALVSRAPVAPDSPDNVRRLGLFWLSVYASVMIAQAHGPDGVVCTGNASERT